MGESFIIACIRRLREYGHGIILADQSISSLKNVAKANCYTVVTLSQSSQKDIREVVNTLGLNPTQADFVNRIAVGQGIVRLAGRFPYPVLIDIPEIPPQFITDKEIDELNAIDPVVQKLLGKINRNAQQEAPLSVEKRKSIEIRLNVKKYLMVLYMNHGSKTKTEISDLAGFSRGTGSRIAKKAAILGLIRMVETKLGKGSPQYPILLPDGYKAVGLPEEPLSKRGGTGPEHSIYQHLINAHFSKQGLKATTEANIKGKNIDVALEGDFGLIAIEVAITASNEPTNVIKDLDVGAAYVIEACRDKDVRNEVLESLSEIPEEATKRVTVCLISELLTRKTSELIDTMNGEVR
jgi:hypothetical protein